MRPDNLLIYKLKLKSDSVIYSKERDFVVTIEIIDGLSSIVIPALTELPINVAFHSRTFQSMQLTLLPPFHSPPSSIQSRRDYCRKVSHPMKLSINKILLMSRNSDCALYIIDTHGWSI